MEDKLCQHVISQEGIKLYNEEAGRQIKKVEVKAYGVTNDRGRRTLPLLFGNHFQTRLHGIHRGHWNKQRLVFKVKHVLKYTQNYQLIVCLPLNTSWSLSSDLTSGSQGLDSSLDLSYQGTKGRRKRNNNEPVV